MPTATSHPDLEQRYDSVERALHWTTVLLVVTLYLLAQVWGFFTKPTANQLVEVHISFGLLLAAIVLVRLFWRLTFGRQWPAVGSRLMGSAATLGHLILYLLLVCTIGLGLCMHWAADGRASFFALFTIASPFPVNHGLGHDLLPFHFWVATALIVIAAGHALMALVHYYVLQDGTLQCMLPRLPARKSRSSAK
jgi:cytochrome b561